MKSFCLTERENNIVLKLWNGQKNNGKKTRMRRIQLLRELGGCCIYCYNTHIWELEGHHPFKISNDPEFMICVCSECHDKLEPVPEETIQKLIAYAKIQPKLGKIVPCIQCGKQVYRRRYQLKANKHIYCSYNCKSEYQRKNHAIDSVLITAKKQRVEKTRKGKFLKCENCGKEIYVKRRSLRNHKHHYCSMPCRSKDFGKYISETKKKQKEKL